MGSRIDDYTREEKCVYKGRCYHVRDNGAIYREARQGSLLSKLDEVWTFGKFDDRTGYMLIGSERVHRIVCTAFKGKPETEDMVVDHINTIRTDNQPENLRWLTRFENILNNPITMARVEVICGSKEAFIANPKLLFGHENKDPNFSWMKDISPQEAKIAYDKMLVWTKKTVDERRNKGGVLGEWIVNKENDQNNPFRGFKRWAYEVMDRTEESYFPLSPLSTVAGEDVLQKYRQRLVSGAEFLVSRGYKTLVSEVVYYKTENKLRVLSERAGALKARWYVFEVWPEGNILIHKYTGTYSEKQKEEALSAVKDLTKYHRQEWKYKHNERLGLNKSGDNHYNNEDSLTYWTELCGEDELDYEGIDDTLYDSLTPNAKQINWHTPNEFICCPKPNEQTSTRAYYDNLQKGKRFAQDKYGHYSEIIDYRYCERDNTIIIFTHKTNGLNQYGICQVSIEGECYIHNNKGTYYNENDARLALTMTVDINEDTREL